MKTLFFHSVLFSFICFLTSLSSARGFVKSRSKPVIEPGAFACGSAYQHVDDILAAALIQQARQKLSAKKLSPPRTYVSGNLVVIEDKGTLIRPPGTNAFDLDDRQLLFRPNKDGGFDISVEELTIDVGSSTELKIGDDSFQQLAFFEGFTFPYLGDVYSRIWIGANGIVWFEEPLARDSFNYYEFFKNVPTIAPLFADLDPTSLGRITYSQSSDALIVTWDGVTEFGNFNSNTVQLALMQDGSFSIAFSGVDIAIPINGFPMIVGFHGKSPATAYEAVNFDDPPNSHSAGTGFFEAFDDIFYREANAALLAQAFYSVQPDSFDQLVLFTNFDLLNAPFVAFHVLVANATLGLGRDLITDSNFFGSEGRLQSFIHMNDINRWPDIPDDSLLVVLGHETAHRWGAFVRFDLNGQSSDLLLGSGLVHWSYFLDSDASVMFGNDWRDNGDGTFRSINILRDYSFLDQYLMGLRSPEEVPPFFYIHVPGANARERAQFPRRGVVVQGTRRQLTVDDILRIEGERLPARRDAQKVFRQAYIMLTRAGQPPLAAEMNKAEEFIAAFQHWFSERTDGRAVMQTRLGPEAAVAAVNGRITNAADGSPVTGVVLQVLEPEFVQPIQDGGEYEFRVAENSRNVATEVTMTVAAFPFLPDTTRISLRYGETMELHRNLQPLPKNSLNGALLDDRGQGVRARLTLLLSSDLTSNFTITDSSDAMGRFSFPDLYISWPGVVNYDRLVIEPEIPFVTETIDDIRIEELRPTDLTVTVRRADLLLVNDDPESDYAAFFTSILDRLDVLWYLWDHRQNNIAPVSKMALFNTPTLIWFTGDGSRSGLIDQEERDSLSAHLDRGGRLFMTGQAAARSLSSTDFLSERVHVSVPNATGIPVLHALQSDPVGDGLGTIVISDFPGANNQAATDIIVPIDDLAKVSILYDTTFTSVKFPAAVRVHDPVNDSRLVFFGFGFEGINGGNIERPGFATPRRVMRNVLSWLSGLTTSVSEPVRAGLIEDFALFPNYPNPFNGETIIRFQLPSEAGLTPVRLEIFNVLGQLVRLLSDEQLASGEYSARWDGRNDLGMPLPSGLYMVHFKAGAYRQVGKIVYVK